MRALITGITGQDGSYMADWLLGKGYEVHGLVRRTSNPSISRIKHLVDQEAVYNRRLFLHYGDMTDGGSLSRVVSQSQPDEIYNFAALSQVRISYDAPSSTVDITAGGFARLLEVVRKECPAVKVYQASSSEMFGKVQEVPQRETTPFYPRSPYGCSKALAFYLGRAYREGYGLKIYNGILFNHESPRRGEEFLSKKVVKAVAEIKAGKRDKLYLGNLDAKRDWGYAKEYVEWIWRMVQEPKADDYVIATGETHTVEEFVSEAFCLVGLDYRNHVVIDKDFMRPAEVDILIGDYSKAKAAFGYEPAVKFKDLVKIMVQAETC